MEKRPIRKEKKFYYFYKITNLVNNKYYYGIHATNDLNDGYMGSGRLMLKALKKYGASSFKKEILNFFNNYDEMQAYEAQVVTSDLVNDINCYNLREGGFYSKFANVNTEKFQQGCIKGAQTKRENGVFARWQIEYKGYNNPEFQVLCKDKYEKDKDEIIFFAKYTDLPDAEIEQLFDKNVHQGKVLQYYEHNGWLTPIEVKKLKIHTEYKVKTFYIEEQPIKVVNLSRDYYRNRMEMLPEVLKFNNDELCSNAKVYNKHKYNFTAAGINFLTYYGFIKPIKNIPIRENTLARTGIKTIYDVSLNIKNILIIDKEKNTYGIDDNGSLIQKGKFRLQDYDSL